MHKRNHDIMKSSRFKHKHIVQSAPCRCCEMHISLVARLTVSCWAAVTAVCHDLGTVAAALAGLRFVQSLYPVLGRVHSVTGIRAAVAFELDRPLPGPYPPRTLSPQAFGNDDFRLDMPRS